MKLIYPRNLTDGNLDQWRIKTDTTEAQKTLSSAFKKLILTNNECKRVKLPPILTSDNAATWLATRKNSNNKKNNNNGFNWLHQHLDEINQPNKNWLSHQETCSNRGSWVNSIILDSNLVNLTDQSWLSSTDEQEPINSNNELVNHEQELGKLVQGIEDLGINRWLLKPVNAKKEDQQEWSEWLLVGQQINEVLNTKLVNTNFMKKLDKPIDLFMTNQPVLSDVGDQLEDKQVQMFINDMEQPVLKHLDKPVDLFMNKTDQPVLLSEEPPVNIRFLDNLEDKPVQMNDMVFYEAEHDKLDDSLTKEEGRNQFKPLEKWFHHTASYDWIVKPVDPLMDRSIEDWLSDAVQDISDEDCGSSIVILDQEDEDDDGFWLY